MLPSCYLLMHDFSIYLFSPLYCVLTPILLQDIYIPKFILMSLVISKTPFTTLYYSVFIIIILMTIIMFTVSP